MSLDNGSAHNEMDSDSEFEKIDDSSPPLPIRIEEELKIEHWLLNCEKYQRLEDSYQVMNFDTVRLALSGHWVINEYQRTEEYLKNLREKLQKTNDLEELAFEVGEFVISFPTDNTVHYYHLLDGEKYNEKVVELSKPAGNEITYLHELSMSTHYHSEGAGSVHENKLYQKISYDKKWEIPMLQIHNSNFDGNCDRFYIRKDQEKKLENLNEEVIEKRSELEKLEKHLILWDFHAENFAGKWETIYEDECNYETIDLDKKSILENRLDLEKNSLWYSDGDSLVHQFPEHRVEYFSLNFGKALLRKWIRDKSISHTMFIRFGAKKPKLHAFQGHWMRGEERIQVSIKYQKLEIRYPKEHFPKTYSFGMDYNSITFIRDEPTKTIVHYKIKTGVWLSEKTFSINEDGNFVITKNTGKRQSSRIYVRDRETEEKFRQGELLYSARFRPI